MAPREDLRSLEDETKKGLLILMFFSLPFYVSLTPHQARQLTWTLTRILSGQLVKKLILLGNSQTTETPSFLFDLCDLLKGDWDMPEDSDILENDSCDYDMGCRGPQQQRCLASHSFYICPSGQWEYNDMEAYYCP